ncbi:DUF3857 domain-containing protein [Massilia pinisoli]|uniref:DUF3857 domain-containing protein n=1 Tax=Massilia pinisoli TaxID=1772194 RepID=A0ABT1ZM66_9BURK|nr:DUF3857 domain-containing protein [Massilia pinisoli]MCS0580996.1 DUF3857 domain-containing protein [Massilia pinisoli]
MLTRYCALLILTVVAFLAPYGTARAHAPAPSVIIEQHVRHYVVEPDGTYRLTVDDARTIAGPRAPGDDGRVTIRYDGVRDALVAVDAYTQKPDGRRIPAPAGSPDHGAGAHIVAFADAAPGDRLVLHYVVRRHAPPFPGQFDDLAVISPHVHRNTLLIYDMPAAMPLHADAVGFVQVPGASPPGRRRYQWRYVNGGDPRTEPDAVSIVDDGPRLAVSTFADYAAFAAAARAATAGKSLPSPAIAALAHRLTAGLPDVRARVPALSEWVRRVEGNATPRAADAMPDLRRGDREDHAALLQALLAAVDIVSTRALVNGGNAYTLPDAPVRDVLDHAILYVPALDLFIDPTTDGVRAGNLPPALLGKPALLLTSGTFAMTPVLQPQRIRAVAVVDIGRGTFSVERALSGALARDDAGVKRDDAVGTLHEVRQRARGVDVAATRTATDDGGENDTMTLSSTGAVDDVPRHAGSTAATSSRAWSAVDAAVTQLLQVRERHHDFVCPVVDAEDDTRLQPPQGLRFMSLPRPADVVAEGIFYRATYARDHDAVLVTRRLTFRHGRATCTPADARAMRPALERIRRDLHSRLAVATRTAAHATPRPSTNGSGHVVAGKRVAPPARAQRGHGLVREVEAQVDAVAARAVAGGPPRDLDEAAAAEETGRVRMRVDRDVAGPQLASSHVQQAVGQQGAADAGAVALGTHEAEHERAEVVELRQFVAAEADDLASLDGDEQRAVRVVQRGTQP